MVSQERNETNFDVLPGPGTLVALRALRGDQRQFGGIVGTLCNVAEFVRRMRVQARFGNLSRARLHLVRLELRGATADCEWVARTSDEWDEHLPALVRERNFSLQALEDAIAIRGLLLQTLPSLDRASLLVYRRLVNKSVELIVKGHISRKDEPPASVRSLLMRAKLYGFHFWLEDGTLKPFQTGEFAING